MAETRELRSVVEAAEQAAGAGDYASAERLLTEAARRQEASLGPLHPDLANTLNNLAIVCEITEKPVDAERYFRRAYAIATAALEPDHPFVATSRKNLEDFCNTRGIAIHEPPPPLVVATEPDVPSSPSVAPAGQDEQPVPRAVADDDDVTKMAPVGLPMARPSLDEPRPVASRRWSASVVIGGVIVGVLLVTLIATAPWRGESVPADVPKQIATENSEPTGVTPKTGDTAPTTPAAPKIVQSPPVPPPAAKNLPNRTSPSRPPIVAAAQLCETLSTGGDWQCVPPSLPVNPGSLFFYSRLKSTTDTTVQHRWYRGERLRQSVELRIRANTSVGYRTYSRQTVDSQGASDWRVELRTSDGVLLHEERFVVR